MKESLTRILEGYQKFRQQFATGHDSLMRELAQKGQKPEIMVVSCCDSRVDPALLLQCNPGELFVVRNVANLIPPYEKDEGHHGTSAALEFGICYLKVKHLILLGHSQCGGIAALMNVNALQQNDFIGRWMDLLQMEDHVLEHHDRDTCARHALVRSYQNCLTFPWIARRIEQGLLSVQVWFFEIENALIYAYDVENHQFKGL